MKPITRNGKIKGWWLRVSYRDGTAKELCLLTTTTCSDQAFMLALVKGYFAR